MSNAMLLKVLKDEALLHASSHLVRKWSEGLGLKATLRPVY